MMHNEFEMSMIGDLHTFSTFKFINLKKAHSLIKQSNAKNYSKDSTRAKTNLSPLLSVLHAIWIKTREEN